MPLDFGTYDRMPLVAPPIVLVVCQVKFPTVLELDAGSAPVLFQKEIIADYPFVERKPLPQLIRISNSRAFFDSKGTREQFFWSFQDRTKSYVAALGSDFLSLEVSKYQNFREFSDRFHTLVETVRKIYPIQLFVRFGLRYVNQVTDATFRGLLNQAWVEKLNQAVIPLRAPDRRDVPQACEQSTRFQLPDTELILKTAFVDKGHRGSKEAELVLDVDSFIERQGEIPEIQELIARFHELNYNAFRWALGDLIGEFEQVHE